MIVSKNYSLISVGGKELSQTNKGSDRPEINFENEKNICKHFRKYLFEKILLEQHL